MSLECTMTAAVFLLYHIVCFVLYTFCFVCCLCMWMCCLIRILTCFIFSCLITDTGSMKRAHACVHQMMKQTFVFTRKLLWPECAKEWKMVMKHNKITYKSKLKTCFKFGLCLYLPVCVMLLTNICLITDTVQLQLSVFHHQQ
jgi:hypothetical protein